MCEKSRRDDKKVKKQESQRDNIFMRKRDKNKNRREIINAFSMILQIGLAMMVCLGISLGIGYYLDKLFQTRFIVIIMMFIGILASLRSMLVLTGVYKPGKREQEDTGEGKVNEDGED